MDIMSLDSLAQEVGGKIPPILRIGGIMVDPEGFVMMNVKIPCVKGYNEDQIAIIMDNLGKKNCPVILGMPTIFRVMEVIKESEISKLAIPWASSRVSWLMRGIHACMSQLNVDNVANKSVAPLSVDEVVRVSHRCKIPPFSHKVSHGSVGLVLQGYKMNVMTHGLEKRSPLLPLRVDIQNTYATLATGSNRVAVVLRNNTWDWLEIGKDNTVADFLSWTNERLPEEEVQEYLNKIPYPGVKAVLDNVIMPIEQRAEQGVQPTPDCQEVCQEEMVGARPARLATTFALTGNRNRRRIQSSTRWLNT